MSSRLRLAPLPLAAASFPLMLVSAGVSAQSPEAPVMLAPVVVEASPFRRTAEELVRPVDVLRGEALEQRRLGTIGDLLADRPGLANASFGPGVGRPVIRGQGGPRVQVLENGIGSMDASSISADHAVGVDPANAEQIEVIKGPATLMYGGGASAGLVNLVDDRLPDVVSLGLLLGGNLSYGSNADETHSALKARYGRGGFQYGLQYGRRQAGDFSVPGFAVRPHDGEAPDPDQVPGLIGNSRLATESYGGSAAWAGERGMLGLAVSRLSSHYGIPAGGHEHAHEEDEEHEGEEEEHHEEEEGHGGVQIQLEQTRYDLRAVHRAPLPGVEEIEARVGVNDYQHQEVEPDGAVGTRFDVQEVEARLQLAHRALGAWRGVAGLQIGHRDFAAVGEEAFVPPTETRSLGLFLVEERPFGEHRLELGTRLDRTAHAVAGQDSGSPLPLEDQDFTAYSLSAGAAFALPEHLHLRVNLQRAQRAPTAEELYAFGPHAATAAFERGDQNLGVETANNLELSLGRDQGPFVWELSAYYNRIQDYVYLQEIDAGLNADGSGEGGSDGEADRVDDAGQLEPEGELLLVDTRQRDASFYGAEASLGYWLLRTAGRGLKLTAMADTVRAGLSEGGDLPRIAPTRFGVGAEGRYRQLSAGLRYLRAAEQDRVAALETTTPGYELLSADLGYALRLGGTEANFYLRGRNLLDESVRASTSFLKDVAPAPGRSVYVGVRFEFEPLS